MEAFGEVRIERLTGHHLTSALPAVARLRIDVFREWPYLYDGSLDYEQAYLADFARAADAIIVAAIAGDEIVGAATAAPLHGHSAEFVPLFTTYGLDPDRVFYLGESVLLPAYRGRGIGHAFFDHREVHGRNIRSASGPFSLASFCAVVRAEDDPRKPAGYRPLDGFWRKRGYAPVDGLIGSYRWKEIGEPAETDKPMQFWMRRI